MALWKSKKSKDSNNDNPLGNSPLQPDSPQIRQQVGNMPVENSELATRSGLRSAGAALAPDEEAGAKPLASDAWRGGQSLQIDDNVDMLRILAEQAGLEYVKLADYKNKITPELLALIPAPIARAYKVFPLDISDVGTLTIAISDPINVRIVDDIRLQMQGSQITSIVAVVANEEEIIDYININYGIGDQTLDDMVDSLRGDSADIDEGAARSDIALDLSDMDAIAQEAPVIRFCSVLLLQAIKDRASDLHIEPFSNVLRIRYRVDGVLREIPSPPKSWQVGIISRFKVIANLDIAESRRPQDGRIKLSLDGREVDLRISTLPVVHGECVVMRLLDKSTMMLGVEHIGMSQDVLEVFLRLIQRPNGIILVTGPTGCGKTTTLYAAIHEINDPTEKIITTEDPVEYQVDGLIQVNINSSVGLTFERCLRAILRQDPDIILVGEIRDIETAQISIQASLTGHLVFSTLHTNSAALTVTRLIDMGVEPFLITSTLEGIVGQRLVRMICSNCKEPYQPTDSELADFGTNSKETAGVTFYKGTGCEECAHSGYKGRIGIFELLSINEKIRDLILDKATSDEIHDCAVESGMKTMRQDGWLKILLGITTFEEVSRHTPKESSETIRKEMKTILIETLGDAVNTTDNTGIIEATPETTTEPEEAEDNNATPAEPTVSKTEQQEMSIRDSLVFPMSTDDESEN